MVLKFELPRAQCLNFPKNSASVLIRLVLIIGDCVYNFEKFFWILKLWKLCSQTKRVKRTVQIRQKCKFKNFNNYKINLKIITSQIEYDDFESKNFQANFWIRKKKLVKTLQSSETSHARCSVSWAEFKSLLSSSLHGCSTRIFPVRGSAQANQRSRGVMRAKQWTK